jgi:hypothetical protein
MPDSSAPAIDYVVFDVDDIDDTIAALKNAALPVVEDAPASLPFWKDGYKDCNIHPRSGWRTSGVHPDFASA